ncbi:MAG TPA: Crp/Fnr family transcriptional regulator [Candidatus Acidoferrum sp.]|nr:Crp/Fnr family transcriptional regulator [Candidatus Acidoferrum sp.]
MPTPYGFEVEGHCETCKKKSQGFFCDLPLPVSRDLDILRHSATYPAGAVLFLEKQDPHGVFILCGGKVKLSISSSEGKTLILRLAEPGEILGLAAVFTGRPYEATAETMHPSQVAFIRRSDFLRLMEKHKEIYQAATRQLSRLYRGACEQLRTIGLSGSAPEKVARLLLEMSSGRAPACTGVSITMPLTHEEIASCIGSTRETVTRTLSDFKAKRLVAFRGSTLTIENREALEDIGGM